MPLSGVWLSASTSHTFTSTWEQNVLLTCCSLAGNLCFLKQGGDSCLSRYTLWGKKDAAAKTGPALSLPSLSFHIYQGVSVALSSSVSRCCQAEEQMKVSTSQGRIMHPGTVEWLAQYTGDAYSLDLDMLKEHFPPWNNRPSKAKVTVRYRN